jgi:branched-chain amino acid transport system permease protein
LQHCLDLREVLVLLATDPLARSLFLAQIINGLLVGSYYIVLSLGLSLIFSLGGVVNLAHGAFYAVGAYLAFEIEKRAGFFGAMALSPVGVALIGILIERFALRRLYSKDPMLGLLFTFGLAITAEQTLRIVWGTTGLPFSMPDALRGQLILGEFIYSYYRLFVLAVAITAVTGCWWLLNKTAFGLVVRAGTRDPEMVRALGINLRPTLTAVFALGVALAGLAGVLSAPLAGVQPAMGTEILTATFVVVVIGGLGSFWGVVVAGLLVGAVRGIAVFACPPVAEASMYLLMVLILLFRPRGLMGERFERFE